MCVLAAFLQRPSRGYRSYAAVFSLVCCGHASRLVLCLFSNPLECPPHFCLSVSCCFWTRDMGSRRSTWSFWSCCTTPRGLHHLVRGHLVFSGDRVVCNCTPLYRKLFYLEGSNLTMGIQLVPTPPPNFRCREYDSTTAVLVPGIHYQHW